MFEKNSEIFGRPCTWDGRSHTWWMHMHRRGKKSSFSVVSRGRSRAHSHSCRVCVCGVRLGARPAVVASAAVAATALRRGEKSVKNAREPRKREEKNRTA